MSTASDQPPSINPTVPLSDLDGNPIDSAESSPSDEIPDSSRATDKKEGGNSKVAVVAAVCGNILVGIVKFIAAGISGSQAMFSEGIHSIVDSGNGLLVLLGLHQSKKPADEEHPFGYGKELYFWTLVVAVLIFAVGGGISLIEGINHLRNITPDTQMGDPTMNIIVILVAACIEGTTLFIAVRQFNKARGEMGVFEFIEYAKDPSLYTVVLEDSAAELGLLFALCGVGLGYLFDNPYIDSIASLLISVLLMAVATVLLRETKKLLVGEGLNKPETRRVIEIVESNVHVVDCGRVLTMYMGPDQLLITIDANFSMDSSASDILVAVDEIEENIKREFPDASRVFIEVESLRNVRMQAQAFELMESEAEEEEREREREAEQAVTQWEREAGGGSGHLPEDRRLRFSQFFMHT